MTAHSKDYVVVMHLSNDIMDLIKSDKLSDSTIQNLFNVYKKTNRVARTTHKELRKSIKGIDLSNNNAMATLSI